MSDGVRPTDADIAGLSAEQSPVCKYRYSSLYHVGLRADGFAFGCTLSVVWRVTRK